MQIEVEVKGQRIKRINSPGSVEDTLNYLTCYFTFDGEEWDNTVKTAYFRNPASGKTYSQILAEDNTCTVPWEALTDRGFVKFSVSGERENYRITTDIESFYNGETVYGGEPSEPPTPSQYDQLIALAEQTKEIAESVREDADAGEFDGEPGKPGDPGKDGVSPSAKVEETNDGAVITVTDATGTTTAKLKNGKDGNPGQDATDEQVRTAVDAYMAEHPVQGDTEDIIKLAIKNEASGAVPIVVTDSADMGVQDIKMQGWTEQAQHHGNQLFDASVFDGMEKSGVSISVKDGVITATGTSETAIWIQSANMTEEDLKKFKSGNIYVKNYKTADCNYEASIYINNTTVKEANSPHTIPDGYLETNPHNVYFFIDVRAGVELKGSIQPMIYQDGDGTWEPYTGGQPSPNPDYPQPITSAGKYDEETQKWEYEIAIANEQTDPDKNQTVTLTADRPLTKWDGLEKRNGQWGWGYKSNMLSVPKAGYIALNTLAKDRKYFTAVNLVPDIKISSNPQAGSQYCNICNLGNPYEYEGNLFWIYRYTENKNGDLRIGLSDTSIDTKELFEQYISDKDIYIWYETAEETFVPLSESEQEALNALHTYYPTTTVSNDAGCDMALTYIADTKAYIDNKVSAIQAAIVNAI